VPRKIEKVNPDRLDHLSTIRNGLIQLDRNSGRLTFEIVRLVPLMMIAMMMTARDGDLLHGEQVPMLGIDQRVLQLRLDHFDAGGIVRMGDDLHCKRPGVTSCAQESNL